MNGIPGWLAAPFFLVIAALAAFDLLKRRHAILAGDASRRWTHTKARVLHAFVDRHAVEDVGMRHRANVRYTYVVDGRCYESTRLSYGQTDDLEHERAIELLQGIVQGREVDAWYDPARPERSVLMRGIAKQEQERHSILLLSWIVIGAVVLLVWLRMRW